MVDIEALQAKRDYLESAARFYEAAEGQQYFNETVARYENELRLAAVRKALRELEQRQ